MPTLVTRMGLTCNKSHKFWEGFTKPLVPVPLINSWIFSQHLLYQMLTTKILIKNQGALLRKLSTLLRKILLEQAILRPWVLESKTQQRNSNCPTLIQSLLIKDSTIRSFKKNFLPGNVRLYKAKGRNTLIKKVMKMLMRWKNLKKLRWSKRMKSLS